MLKNRAFPATVVNVALLALASVASLTGTRWAQQLGVSDWIAGISVFLVWPAASLVCAVWSVVLAIVNRRVHFVVLAVMAAAMLGLFLHTVSQPN